MGIFQISPTKEIGRRVDSTELGKISSFYENFRALYSIPFDTKKPSFLIIIRIHTRNNKSDYYGYLLDADNLNSALEMVKENVQSAITQNGAMKYAITQINSNKTIEWVVVQKLISRRRMCFWKCVCGIQTL